MGMLKKKKKDKAVNDKSIPEFVLYKLSQTELAT